TTAAQWVIRRSGGAWTETDQRDLDSWLNESTLHRVEYLRLEAVWRQTARLKALGAGAPTRAHPPEERAPRAKRWLALAASLVLIPLGAYWISIYVQDSNQYSTAIGHMQTVHLADGSEVTLDTNTRLRTYFRASERRIELDSGAAYFVVAKDPS